MKLWTTEDNLIQWTVLNKLDWHARSVKIYIWNNLTNKRFKHTDMSNNAWILCVTTSNEIKISLFLGHCKPLIAELVLSNFIISLINLWHRKKKCSYQFKLCSYVEEFPFLVKTRGDLKSKPSCLWALATPCDKLKVTNRCFHNVIEFLEYCYKFLNVAPLCCQP